MMARLTPGFEARIGKINAQQWKIPANFMFIGSPGDHFLYGLAEFGRRALDDLAVTPLLPRDADFGVD